MTNKKKITLGTYEDEPMDLKVLVGSLCDFLGLDIIEVTDSFGNLKHYEFDKPKLDEAEGE